MISLQKLIDRLIEIRDKEKISPTAPILLVEDALPGHSKHKGMKIRISELDEGHLQYVVSGHDGYIAHGDNPTEADHAVYIYWEPV